MADERPTTRCLRRSTRMPVLRRRREGPSVVEERRRRIPRFICSSQGSTTVRDAFDKTIGVANQRAEIEPNNPEGSRRSLATTDETRRRRPYRSAEEGLHAKAEAVDKAISLKSDYVEAITFRGSPVSRPCGEGSCQAAAAPERGHRTQRQGERTCKKAAGIRPGID